MTFNDFSPSRVSLFCVQVLVQPSNRRAYPMAAYANVGAKIQEDISEASVIFGVKQVNVLLTHELNP